jgi:hypothetical protein
MNDSPNPTEPADPDREPDPERERHLDRALDLASAASSHADFPTSPHGRRAGRSREPFDSELLVVRLERDPD